MGSEVLAELETSVRTYGARLNAFLEHHHPLRAYVRACVEKGLLDHVARKVDGTASFEDLVAVYSPFGRQLPVISDRDRRITGFALNKPLRFGMGIVHYLEILEPIPGAKTPNSFTLDHIEFAVGKLADAKKAIKTSGIRFEPEHSSDYNWVSHTFGANTEIRFSNLPLRDYLGK